jgi:hypothetical protein
MAARLKFNRPSTKDPKYPILKAAVQGYLRHNLMDCGIPYPVAHLDAIILAATEFAFTPTREELNLRELGGRHALKAHRRRDHHAAMGGDGSYLPLN